MSNPLDLSDEDFLKAAPPVVPEDAAETVDAPVAETSDDEDETQSTAPSETEESPDADDAAEPPSLGSEDDADSADSAGEPGGNDAGETPKTKTAAPASSPEGGAEKPAGQPSDAEKKPADKTAEPAAEPDYKAFYHRVIGKPIRANGKDLVLKTEEEVERFIQMGAGFGRKLQEIQPHLKTLRMLESKNLLDVNQLSFLIDIHEKNPEAIKKLIKDSGIDPLDLNIEDNTEYTPRDHTVSDEQARLHEALDDLQKRPQGLATIREIDSRWDTQSKELLLKYPETLSVIQDQRENGIYAKIVDEIDRQKLLGAIKPETPFLEAYKQAGDYLVSQNSLNPDPKVAPQQMAPQPSQPTVIDTRPVKPKPQAANNERVRAAAPSQSSKRPAKQLINPLQMADDEFLKQFGQL